MQMKDKLSVKVVLPHSLLRQILKDCQTVQEHRCFQFCLLFCDKLADSQISESQISLFSFLSMAAAA